MSVVGTEKIRLAAGESRRIERAVMEVRPVEGKVLIKSASLGHWRNDRDLLRLRSPSCYEPGLEPYPCGSPAHNAFWMENPVGLRGAEDVALWAAWGDVDLELVFGKPIETGEN